MDPDPFSLYSIIFITLLLLSLVYLFLISSFGLALKKADKSELNKLEKSNPSVYAALSFLYNGSNNLSLLFAISKLVLIVFGAFSSIILLYSFGIHYLIGIGIIFSLIFIATWLLPLIFVKSNSYWLVMGIKSCSFLLKYFLPFVNWLAPQSAETIDEDVSLEELQTVLPEEDMPTPSKANLNLYKQVLRFDKIIIKNIMRPKQKMEGIKSNYNFREVLSKIETSTHSRLPVYNGNWDKVLGIIHCKDLLPFTDQEKMNWQEKIRPIIYVNENDDAQSVLRIFQHGKNHMALVTNNKKKLVGLVTLEDITEEIIGEIED